MDQELTMEQMAEYLYGKQARGDVYFFDGEVRDETATLEQGKRVMIPGLYIRIQFPKENVDITRLATARDIEKYVPEMEVYQQVKKVSVARENRKVRRRRQKAEVLNWPTPVESTGGT